MPIQDVKGIVDQLSLEEQVSLLSGQDSWSVAPVARLKIGSLVVTDGPNGARGSGGILGGVKAAAFPVGIALGSTWNPELLKRVGAALAEETRDKGAHVLLGPTINLQRGPLNGRNFECFSEDPMLTGALAVAYVHGLQENGVAAMPKHFIANETEIDRAEVSSDVDERSLRELYLAPFERVVKAGGAWAVMSSYNRLNGTFTSEHPWLLTKVLRENWGFDGAVVSDWYGSHSTVATMMAGLDIEMPGPTRDRGTKLIKAVEDGEVARETVRHAALNVLRLMERCGALHDQSTREEKGVDRPSARALIREAAAEGMVLLKNEDALLPLKADTKIALIGPNAKIARTMGGGSSQLNAHRQVSTWDALSEVLGAQALTWAMGCRNNRFEPVLTGEIKVEWFDNQDLLGPAAHVSTIDTATLFLNRDSFDDIPVDKKWFSLRVTATYTPEASGRYRIGVHCAGRGRVLLDGREVIDAWENWIRGATFFEEGCDPQTVDVDLVAGIAHEVRLEFRSAEHIIHDFSAFYLGLGKPSSSVDIDMAVAIAETVDVAVLCVGRNAEWDTEGWDLPSMDLPGDQDALISAVAAKARKTIVLLQTGGPVTMPWINEVDAVLQAWYPGQEAGYAIADVMMGRTEPSGRLPQSFPLCLGDAPNITEAPLSYPGVDGHIHYAEKLSIGYRHHDTNNISPLFPFGHGLGYTSFSLGDVYVNSTFFEADGNVSVTANVTNVGARQGKTVAQLYIAPINGSVNRPTKELKAFAKLTVAAGESKTFSLDLCGRDFAWFSVEQQAWIVSPGDFALMLGFSSENAKLIAELHRDTELALPV